MIEVVYRRDVPYPREVVLSQYFDFEHLEHVHPNLAVGVCHGGWPGVPRLAAD